MNEKLVNIMFFSSGLPASAMVSHARLKEDLGLDKSAISEIVNKLNTTFGICIPESIWLGFEKAGDIDNYVKSTKDGGYNQ
jgi:acyl carrier protein